MDLEQAIKDFIKSEDPTQDKVIDFITENFPGTLNELGEVDDFVFDLLNELGFNGDSDSVIS